MQENLKKAEDEKDNLSATIKRTGLVSKVMNEVKKEFLLDKSDILKLMESDGYTLEEDNGIAVFKKGGEIVRNQKTQSPEGIEAVFSSFAESKKLAKDEEDRQGRGGKTTKKSLSSATTLSELRKEFEERGESINGSEFNAKMQELSKDNPDFFNE